MATQARRPLVVVMGVCGAGKSTIGQLVADQINVTFIDSDSLHPPANVEKMAAGIPLNDEDRWPWLARVGAAFADSDLRGEGLVIACSSLKRSYRQAILDQSGGVFFLHLSGASELLAERLRARKDHYMPPALLQSQLDILEELADDERGASVDIAAPVSEVVALAVAAVTAVVV